jgi:Family of unknown function (DUF6600)
MGSTWIAAVLLIALALMGAATGVAADGPTGPDAASWEVTPPRVSYVGGEAAFWRPGAEGWTPAQVNLPLAPGDALAAGADGTVEVQVGPRAFVRAAGGAQLGLESQEPDFLRFSATAGHVALDLRDLPAGHTLTLDTPHAVLTVEHPGYYRVSLSPDTTTVAVYRGGRATVAPTTGTPVTVAAGQQLTLAGAEEPTLAISGAPELSAWDRWNYQRTDSLIAYTSARYVPPDVYGAETLDRYGAWRVVETYGPVWVPTAVPSHWAPYTTGRWLWDPRYGWTWLDEAPWGWAPFHYGRWVFVNGAWGWAPGPVVARPVYVPALVAFLDGPVIVERPVCWVALGWGEPVSPWWGRPGFVGRPWWGGWGGPRVVNNVVINRTTVVNIENITVYRNMGVRNAVVAVPPQRFGRDPVAKARIAHVEVAGLRPRHGPPPVRPVAASLVPADAREARPPETVLRPRGPERQGPVVSPDGRGSADAHRGKPHDAGPAPRRPAASQPADVSSDDQAPKPKPSVPADRALAPPPAPAKPGRAAAPAPPTVSPASDDPLASKPAEAHRKAQGPGPGRQAGVPPDEPPSVAPHAGDRPVTTPPGVVKRGHSLAPPPPAASSAPAPGPHSPGISKAPPPPRPMPAPPGLVGSGRPPEPAVPDPSPDIWGHRRPGPPSAIEGPGRQKPGRGDGPRAVDRIKAPGPPPDAGPPDAGVAMPRLSGGLARPPVVPRESVSMPPAQSPARASKVVSPNPAARHAAPGPPMPAPIARQPEPPGRRPEAVRYAPAPGKPPPAVAPNPGQAVDHGPRKPPGPRTPSADSAESRGSKADAPSR